MTFNSEAFAFTPVSDLPASRLDLDMQNNQVGLADQVKKTNAMDAF